MNELDALVHAIEMLCKGSELPNELVVQALQTAMVAFPVEQPIEHKPVTRAHVGGCGPPKGYGGRGRKGFAPKTVLLMQEIAKRWDTESLDEIGEALGGLSHQYVATLGKKAGLPKKTDSRRTSALANQAAKAARQQARIEREQRNAQLATQLRDLVERQGLSVREARRQLGIKGRKLEYLSRQAGIVSMFGRWPANRQRAKASGINGRVPMPWARGEGRRSGRD